MTNVISMVEDKINQIQKDLQNARTYLTQITEAIKKLTNDKKNIHEQILSMTGALQAYSSTKEVCEGCKTVLDSNEAK